MSKLAHKLDREKSNTSPGGIVLCLCGLEAVAGAGWPNTHCPRDDTPTPAPAPMTLPERLRTIRFSSNPDDYDAITIEAAAEIDALTARVAELERHLATASKNVIEGADETLKCCAEVERLESELAAARKDARRDALEEAASECLILERDDAVDCPSGPAWKWYGKSRDHAAARIRALQTKDTTE